MILYIIAGVFAVALLGLLAVFIGPDRFVAFWKALPAVVRTWIHAALGAIALWCLTDGLKLITDLSLPTWAKGIIGAIGAALTTSGAVALNPADTRFGVGKVVQGEVLDETPAPAEDEPGSPA